MIRNYLKIAIRNLRKHPQSTAISILGLAVSLLCFAYIHLFVTYERSYDNFHDRSEDIYRVVRQSINNAGQRENETTTSFAVAGTLARELQEVEFSTAIFPSFPVLIKSEFDSFYEDKLVATDSNFFHVFTFPLVSGSPSGLLSSKESAVVTQSTARKYFGDTDPIGKAIDIEGRGRVYITAVAEDVPSNSHLKFNVLILRQPFEDWEIDNWGPTYCITYTKLLPDSNPKVFVEHVRSLAAKFKPNGDDKYDIQPLTNIHLSPPRRGELEAGGDPTTLNILTLISYFILLVAAVNYINMATAQSSRRAKEVAMRKTSGARREQLALQFLAESVVTVSIALSIALLLCIGFERVFIGLVGKPVSVIDIVDSKFLITLMSISVATGIVSGFYPALFLSSFNPVRVLKGIHVKQSSILRKILVGMQFAISIGLIISVIIIIEQVNYITTKNLGFEKEQVIVLPNVYNLSGRNVLEQKLGELANVIGIGASTSSLDKAYWTSNVRTDFSEKEMLLNFCQVNYDYINTLGIRLKSGRQFSREMPVDTFNTIILNETAVKELGLKDPIGQKLIWKSSETFIFTEVVGVVEDFHYASIHEPIRPFALLVQNRFFVQHDFTSKLFIRVNSRDYQEVLGKIEQVWKEILPDKPFAYYFLDDSFNALHRGDFYFRKVVSWLTAITIVISCFGLLALTAFIIDQRTKEFGIRKILGATSENIFKIMMTEFLIITTVAFIVVSPIAWSLMNGWLASYAYRIDIGAGVFLLAAVISVIIVMMVTSYQTSTASKVNPVNSLKRE